MTEQPDIHHRSPAAQQMRLLRVAGIGFGLGLGVMTPVQELLPRIVSVPLAICLFTMFFPIVLRSEEPAGRPVSVLSRIHRALYTATALASYALFLTVTTVWDDRLAILVPAGIVVAAPMTVVAWWVTEGPCWPRRASSSLG